MGLKHWVIVPVKDPAIAKKRLAAALGSLREAFAREMALRTLSTVCGSGHFDEIVVVTSDPSIRAACRSAQTRVLDDDDLGLNEACSRGLRVAATHEAELASIIHSDIATLNVQTLSSIVRQYLAVRAVSGTEAIGMVRCKDGSGTNMILLDPSLPFCPRFGPGSFAAHVREAGARAHELSGGEAAFDIDTPQDLKRLFSLDPRPDWLNRYAVDLKGPPALAAGARQGIFVSPL